MPSNGESDSLNTERIRNAVAGGLEKNGFRKWQEMEISTVHKLSTWTLGLLTAAFVAILAWMGWLTTNLIETKNTIEKASMILESQSSSWIKAENQININTGRILTAMNELSDLQRRLAILEGGAAQGARYTARDGETERQQRENADMLLTERLKMLGERLDKIVETQEAWHQKRMPTNTK